MMAIEAVNPVATMMDANEADTPAALLGDQSDIAETAVRRPYGSHKAERSDGYAYGRDKARLRGALSHDAISSRDPTSAISVSAALMGEVRPQLEHLDDDRSAASGAKHSSHIDSVAFEIDTPIAWSPFSIWLSLMLHAHGDKILRFKAILNVAEWGAPVSLDAVHHIVYPPRHLARWPCATGVSRLVFIVRDLNVALIAPSLRAFLARHTARRELSVAS